MHFSFSSGNNKSNYSMKFIQNKEFESCNIKRSEDKERNKWHPFPISIARAVRGCSNQIVYSLAFVYYCGATRSTR